MTISSPEPIDELVAAINRLTHAIRDLERCAPDRIGQEVGKAINGAMRDGATGRGRR
jgi:hypothetical protein